MAKIVKKECPIYNVGSQGNTSGDIRHHFFGYYNKSTWNKAQDKILCQDVSMFTGDLDGSVKAKVGYFPMNGPHVSGDYVTVGETSAWNWQMGCQAQWLNVASGQEKIIYNCRKGDAGEPVPADATQALGTSADFQSVIFDVKTGEKRALPVPVYVVAPNGEFALTVNYDRFMTTHKTIGYMATKPEEQPELPLYPDDEGIFRVDIETGDVNLIVSLERLRNFQPVPSMEKALHWATHIEVNPCGDRFLFIHRWTERVEDETCFLHRLFTVNGDGSDLRLLECSDHPLPQLADDFDINAVGTFDYEKSEYQISHPIWKNDDEVIVWGPHAGAIHYHLYNDKTGDVSIIGKEILDENGHMTYSNDDNWILSDTYPDAETDQRILFLYHVPTDTRYDIGSFYTPADLGKHNRCDLHPRWSHDNKYVCIDSVHEGERQMYVLEVEDLMKEFG